MEEIQTVASIYGEYKSKRDKLLDSAVMTEQTQGENPKSLDDILKESKLGNSAKDKIRKELLEKELREKLGLVEKPKEYAVNLHSPSAPPYV